MESIQIRSIVKVKKKKKIPVYDITVPENHNFVLANGLVVHNCQPYEVLRNAMYEGRVTLLDDEDQTNELISLEKHASGKIDKPLGGQDDTSQCLAGAVYLASKAKEELLSSGAVLLQNISSSGDVTPEIDPSKAVEQVMEKHFSQYSENAIMVNRSSGFKDEWESFFGKKEKEKPKDINLTAYWG